ncbi:alkaline phosphatase family protein [Portibacter marinus]|uniref:alkaline phosphatase family protein n=1 Tax=Portibacter marinus TaxID=2898660 RepID=UPI001F328936|nr:alkaline phosphatase family protein [Portibacter marinus]
MKRKVLLIGWDAADWKFLSPLMDEGKLPNLTKLVEGGVKGRLATLDPPLSPTLWTSIATGKRPYKHGIHGFTEPAPNGDGIRAINSSSRKVKAIWNILTQCNMKSNVVGWWPSHPAEPINGVMISNFFQNASGDFKQEWPMSSGSVHPKKLEPLIKDLRIHPQELTQAHILPFVPDAYKIDQTVDNRLNTLNKITAECASIQSVATYLLEHTEWDFSAIYFDAIDHYCHAFMQFHPPYRDHIDKYDFEIYKDVISGACIFHDMMLGRLMDLVGKDTTIMLISDHGFYPDHNRPKSIPNEPSGPAIEHSPYGIIVVNGPGIKKDGLLYGASLLDITPTILSLFGLPIARDMDGKVLTQIYSDTTPIEKIDSWEDVKGDDGSHPPGVISSKKEIQAELQQLIDLGYIDDPGDDIQLAIKNTVEENNFYLSRSYYNGNQWSKGIEILEQLLKESPHKIRYAQYLLKGYLSVKNYKKSRILIDKIKEQSQVSTPQLDINEATLLMAERKYTSAIDIFQKIIKEAGQLPGIALRVANAYIQLNQYQSAEKLLIQDLLRDPEEAYTHYTLGICFFKQGKYEAAIKSFVEGIGLHYYFPAAHFYIGESLLRLAHYRKAIESFEICLSQVPGLESALEKIIYIYEQYLNDPQSAQKYRDQLKSLALGEITIVSGLPRSGTSMMMQMLNSAGMDIYSDEVRKADESNPKGYFEHENIKSLINNKEWITEAEGKVVKVIAHLLPHLPPNYKYKIIFMERDVTEIIQSQQRMIVGLGKKVDDETLPLHLYERYKKTIRNIKKWASEKPNVEILYLSYSEVVSKPLLMAVDVAEFLENSIDPIELIRPIEPALYREKNLDKIGNN